ncbi:MAG: hypothetical protein EXR98_10830 [Gemmataceae bacterium]|nr:hypothetical protein [Gemmataceae bacterium]
MNKQWILDHLREAQEELTRTIAQIESEPEYGDIEFEIALAHLYSHVNTAWNSRGVDDASAGTASDDEFCRWRAFPVDIADTYFNG